jgi:SagB-type dehydrogenase family enzyme
MPDPRYRLSPYCVFWVDPGNQTAQLVHGLYGSRFEISIGLLRLLTELATGTSLEAALARSPEGSGDAMQLLVEEKVLVPEAEAGELANQELFRNRLTSLELAFHRGVNEGGYLPSGMTGIPPPPVAEATGGTTIPLQLHPDAGSDIDLAACLSRRRSIRAFGDKPLPMHQLETFLQLAARADVLWESPGLGWVSLRNYPSGGARYPLEIYPVVYNVESLQEGIYHYRPFSHSLERLASGAEERARLVEVAQHRMAQSGAHGPAVLFIVAAVFARTCWKYRGMAYQAILMETGALYQTMYLAATALELAPCAIGAFPELATAEILRLDSRDVAQVGFFALGVADDRAPKRLYVTAARVVRQTPFSRNDDDRAIELAFDDGSRQIMPADELRVQQDEAGTLYFEVMRGRREATIADNDYRELLRALDGKRRPPA